MNINFPSLFRPAISALPRRPNVAVIGAGLAGCECALVLAQSGITVTLFEMKPEKFSPAHISPNLAELVCSNSFRSDAPDSAVGLLKEEMRQLGSLTMQAAEKTRVPAGKALAVDRELFSGLITEVIANEPGITLIRREITNLAPDNPDLAGFDKIVLAAGPLASESLAQSLAALAGEDHLYFYDAIAPVVEGASIDMSVAFRGARYQPEDTDYVNCPMTREEYFRFYEALLSGEKAKAHGFEKEIHFEGCMPVEALAERGEMTLAFGSLKPVGFTDPRTGKRPFALLQLRAENANQTMFNLVGCQTKLTYPEQARIFRLVPGLEKAEFARFGSMHRNTFVNAPQVLAPDLSLKSRPDIHLAGQITGVEGYVESAASGLMAGLSLAASLAGRPLPDLPVESCLGALMEHLKRPVKHFQPSNVQFGLMPELGVKAGKANRKELYAKRTRTAFAGWIEKAGAMHKDVP